jgi:hypothetical protein
MQHRYAKCRSYHPSDRSAGLTKVAKLGDVVEGGLLVRGRSAWQVEVFAVVEVFWLLAVDAVGNVTTACSTCPAHRRLAVANDMNAYNFSVPSVGVAKGRRPRLFQDR